MVNLVHDTNQLHTMSLTKNTEFDDEDVENEIAELEARLQDAKQRLASKSTKAQTKPHNGISSHSPPSSSKPLATSIPSSPSAHHYLLLLSDSALPLGSFAYSSGLESYTSHNKRATPSTSSFSHFLPLSLSAYASTTLPYVLSAHRHPTALASLDDTLDASIICTVGRRASVAQGRALLATWERSFAAALASDALRPFIALWKRSAGGGGAAADDDGCGETVSVHLAPLFGAVAGLMGLTLRQTAYVFLLSHAKALISAAVRLHMMGPFQAQKVLAGGEIQDLITIMIDREWETPVEEAGQTVPVMDLWMGRHEIIYSRIFNS